MITLVLEVCKFIQDFRPAKFIIRIILSLIVILRYRLLIGPIGPFGAQYEIFGPEKIHRFYQLSIITVTVAANRDSDSINVDDR